MDCQVQHGRMRWLPACEITSAEATKLMFLKGKAVNQAWRQMCPVLNLI